MTRVFLFLSFVYKQGTNVKRFVSCEETGTSVFPECATSVGVRTEKSTSSVLEVSVNDLAGSVRVLRSEEMYSDPRKYGYIR